MTSPNIQKYLFDLHGYLVIEDVLNADEVAELNRLIDKSGHTIHGGGVRHAPRRRRGEKRERDSSNGDRPSRRCSITRRSCPY